MATAKDVQQALQSAPAQQPVVNTVESLLKSPNIRSRFEEMLKDKAPGFISSIISAVTTNGNLKACHPMSVIASAAIAASLDLPINSNLGYAHIVPYSGRAQFQMGWRGYVQLAMRSREYKNLHATEVYDDELKFWNALTGEFEFTEPSTWKQRNEGQREKIVGYMAFFKLLNGFEKYVYMTKAQAAAHGKRYSKSYTSGPWKTDFDSMALKTVTKSLLGKWGILSIDMQKAIESDQAVVNPDNSLEYADAPTLEFEASTVEALPETAQEGKPETETVEAPKDKNGKELKF